MNDIAELVHLPDPAVQPLVHPLDLPEARGHFRRWWLIGVLTSPPVAFCVAALVWFASQSYVVPLIAAGALVVVGVLASHLLSDEAWAYIPRRRQDRARPLPISWDLGSAVLVAALLAAVLVLVAFRLSQPDVAPQVRAFTFGMGAAVGLMEVVKFVDRVLRQRGSGRRAALLTLPGVLVVGGCLALAYDLLFGTAGPSSVALTAWGGAFMLLMALLVELARRSGLVR